MSTPNKRPGMPKPDRAHLGQYLPMTPQTHPESFRNPTEQAAWRARRAEVEAYLRLSEDDATAAPTARPTVAGTEESDDDVPEPDDSGDEDWQPGPSRRRSTATRRQAAPIPAQTVSTTSPPSRPCLHCMSLLALAACRICSGERESVTLSHAPSSYPRGV